MFLTDYSPNGTAIRAAKRQALQELERLAKVEDQLKSGLITAKKAKELLGL